MDNVTGAYLSFFSDPVLTCIFLCGETNFVHIFVLSVYFKQKSEVSVQKTFFTTASAIISYFARKGKPLFTNSDQIEADDYANFQ